MNAAAVGNMARSLWSDLREKRLWPLALALAVGLIAVPVLLSHSAASSPATPVAGAGAAGSGVPALNVSNASANGRLYGRGHDPFGQSGSSQSHAGSSTSTAVTGGITSTGSTTSSGGSAAAGTGAGVSAASGSPAPSTATSAPAPAGGAPPPPLAPSKPAPAPTGLSSLESYRVAISATNASGGVNAVDPVVRLNLFPSTQQPLVSELGVLKGGDRVLFAVAPGTTLRGPGACIPGPIDCEILSLGTNQIESASTSASSAPATMFAVTGISAQSYGSTAAASNARGQVSVPGLAAIRQWKLPALSLFEYQAAAGAQVDLRDVTVGG